MAETDIYNENLDLIAIEPEQMRTEMLTTLEEAIREPLYPGDERRIFAEALTAVLVGERFLVNDTAKQTMLKYARGQVLNALGERVGASRLDPDYAKTTLQFSTAALKSYNIIIPKYTKVTADNVLYFATDEETVLRAGEREVSVAATALYGGSEYNGLLPGSIGTIVDQIAGINGVTNLTETAGGDDGEPYTEEGDDKFRERIRLAVNAFSIAGSAKAYEYWAKTANANIEDVKAIVPRVPVDETVVLTDGRGVIVGDGIALTTIAVYPHGGLEEAVLGVDYTLDYSYGKLTIIAIEGGILEDAESIDVSGEKDLAGHVYIYPLMKDGELPSEAECAEILAVVNAADRHPMTDYIHVLPPERVDFGIDITYYVTAADAAAALETIEGAGGAIERYIKLQSGEIGRDINPDDLRRLILSPDWSDTAVGAVRLEVNEPEFTALKEYEVGHFVGEVIARRVII